MSRCADPAGRAEAWLKDAIPPDRRKLYDPRRILEGVLDRESIFEIGRYHGGSTVTCLARLGGIPVGVMANDPKVAGGAMTRAAAQKTERFVDLCDTFHLPVVNFVDQPGLMTGVQAEEEGTITAALRAIGGIEQSATPWVTIIVRRAFGVTDIIDPRETRALLCDWAREAWEVAKTQVGPRHRTLR